MDRNMSLQDQYKTFSFDHHSILVIVNDPVDFGNYTSQILIAEGFREFQIKLINDITLDLLKTFDIVLLTETKLTDPQAVLFDNYVIGGGCLIAFKPDHQLARIFGLALKQCTIEEGYLSVNNETPVGKGITPETMQFHGTADGYLLNGAVTIATLFSDASTPTDFPAVTWYAYEKGQAVAFTYNLPKSIIYTRQGNPAWAGQERDGILGIRAAEMYLGWVDPSKNHLNQADEQMRLLSHIIEDLSESHKPLPRMWYFPGFYKCLVILTDDGEDSTESDFLPHIADIESKGAHITLYLKNLDISPATVARWVSQGHEIACHFDDTVEAIQPTRDRMNSVASLAVQQFWQVYGLKLKTVRNHWIVWVGWVEQAEIEANHGIGLDCNLYHYDLESTSGHYLGSVGNFNGSGLPMKFVNSDGCILDIYQSPTQLPDEQWLESYLYGGFKTLVDRSLDQEIFTFININFHTNQWQVWSRKPGLDMLEYVNKRGVPLWTAEHLLNFLNARDSASFKNIVWDGRKLSFTLEAPVAGQNLTFMLPRKYNDLTLTKIEKDGNHLPVRRMVIKGRTYALAEAGSGGTFSIQANYIKKSNRRLDNNKGF